MSDAVAHAQPHGHAVHRDHHPALQHHFETLSQQKEASTLGMWVFLGTEVLFFGGLFAAYSIYRGWYPDAFAAASHTLDITLGTINNTIINRPGPIFMEQRLFVENLARALRLVSAYDELVASQPNNRFAKKRR